MAIGSGLSGSFGWSKQTADYSTRVAPAKFIRHRRCDFQPVYNRVQGEGIQSGALGLRGDQLVQTHQGATASVEFDVTTLNMVQLAEAIMGGSSSLQLGGTAAYGHTFALADPSASVAKGLTLQQNVALRDGTNKAKEITGARVTSATFSVGVGELLTGQVEFDGRKYDDGQSLAAASYVSGLPFHFGQARLDAGTYASETALTGIRAFSVTISRPQDTEAFTFNASGFKSAPVLNAPTEITGTIEADYLATADFEERMTDMTLPSLVFTCRGDNIASSFDRLFQVTIPGVHIEGPGQNNDGYDVPRNQWNYTWKYDGTNLPTIYIISTETTV
jgi:hypothetical protein